MAEKASEAIQASKKIDAELKQEKLRKEQQQAASESGKAPGFDTAGKAVPKAGEKPEAKKEEKKEERKIVLERTLVVPLSKAYRKPRSHRARIAVSLLKQFISRHAKTPVESVRVAAEVNSLIQARGARRPPKAVRIRVSKDDKGVAEVFLAK